MAMIDLARAVSLAAREGLTLDRQDAAKRDTALPYLRETDWMVIRKMEINTPVPPDVTKQQAQVRAAQRPGPAGRN